MGQTYSIGGKVFILGEYAALLGLPSLVAALPPRFSMQVLGSSSSPSFRPHPDAPAGRLFRWAKEQGWPEAAFSFEDPLFGSGGFGASTAQFALAYFALSQARGISRPSWKEVWTLYRELLSGQDLTPSGSDLVAQWQGGVQWVHPSEGVCDSLWESFDWSNLLVFSATQQAGRKVPTHGHLLDLSQKESILQDSGWISGLKQLLFQGVSAVRENDPIQLGSAMDQYAESLSKVGLEVSATTEDRMVLRAMSGVLGVKGSGALQSDAILVLVQPECDRDWIIQIATDRGLRLVSNGLHYQKGVL